MFESNTVATHRRVLAKAQGITADPLWYKTAIIYEVHVRAFCDSNGDGIGDFPGLTSKLDYLQDLGVTALWLLPFYPSPLRDGGYDIADYANINPSYGTLDDFKHFLDEAHQRGLRVITELVLNHTSVEHAWFQRARQAPPGSPERDFYVWSDTPDRYTSTRIIFKDFETSNWAWDPVAKAYYWHRFYTHQPDLNFDNPAVHEATIAMVDYWLGMGVDGLRLDAVPYLYERDGTSCENLPETHQFLKKLRAHIDTKFTDKMLLAEANQWPEDAAAYFGQGDECHMNFHFPLMPRMFMAVQMEDCFPLIDILRQTPAIPANAQWATFLRNHDELTLEMVTDEERDYMYRTYSEDTVARINLGIRRRLAPLLKSRNKVELLNALLFSMPGTPVLYYGDEIGMGDNVYLGDRDGVRTPMQWSADRNAGFSRGNPQRMYLPIIIDPEYHYEAINVEMQQSNSASILWWTKRLIALRKQFPVFGTGEVEFLHPDNARILAFIRCDSAQRVLVVANLSRYPQYTELDLRKFAGTVPTEIVGRTLFPPVTDQPYPVMLGPHAFYWFLLEPVAAAGSRVAPMLQLARWTELALDRERLARLLAAYAADRRWFRGKARTRRAQRIADIVELPCRQAGHAVFAVLDIDYAEGEAERYLVPLMFQSGDAAVHLEQTAPHAVFARLEESGPPASRGVVYDALGTGEAAAGLLDALVEARPVDGEVGRLVFVPREGLSAAEVSALSPRPTKLEQTNTTVPFGERVVLKVLRQLDQGVNAEIELGLFLTEHGPAGLVPKVLGSVEYVAPGGAPASVAVAHEYIPNQGVAWDLMLGHLETLFDRALAEGHTVPAAQADHVLEQVKPVGPTALDELGGVALRQAKRMGQRTGQVHRVLATGTTPAMKPEPFTHMHQQSMFQGARARLVRTCEVLTKQLPKLAESVRPDVEAVLAARPAIEASLRQILAPNLVATRIRTHGDLHLGQILFTGDDFMLIDFEGEPALPLSERRYKRSPLRDVAGMLRSFSYAAETALGGGHQREQDLAALRPWAAAWTRAMSVAYLEGYQEAVEGANILPPSANDRRVLLDFNMLEKCIYEIGYELNNRPVWLPIPIRGLLALVRGRGGAS